MKTDDIVNQVEKELIEKGLLIEAGFAGFNILAINKNVSPQQLAALRSAFYAGAQHLYITLMRVMDSDREPTAADLRKMELIHNELEAFKKSVLEPAAKRYRESKN